MKTIFLNIGGFILDHKEAILTFLSAVLFRRFEKPYAQKKTAKEIHDSLLEGKTMYDTFKKHLKH